MSAVVSEGVAMAMLNPFDQPMQTQPAQVAAHLDGAVRSIEQSGDKDAKAPVSEAGDGVQR
jgi:hypothetical protein